MNAKVFELKVTKIESTCIFELNWEAGKKITVSLQYSNSLGDYYQQWRKAYLDYYRNLRGRKTASGKGSIKKDFRSHLVNTHSKLLDEFHRWLFSAELIEIRREIANSVNYLSDNQKEWVEVFLTCTPVEIARLPWETWEIGTDLGVPKRIRIARNPANIRNQNFRPLHRKVRILAILGDDTGLNFDSEKEEFNKIKSIAYVKFIGWTLKKNIDELKQEIVQNIAATDGWDILFFAGHSNESVLTGGELGIAPNASIFVSEIEDALKLAKKRGLQFAIFNSCSGINIAESLINLGLSQVVVMREPINNKVAQEFLKQFLRSLTEYKDVHESLLDASKFLKQQQQRLAYPSTYLVPSLFRHPSAELFCIQPFGLFSIIKQWLPTSKEAKWLGIFLLISLIAPLQELFLDSRFFLQAVYRQVTEQVLSDSKPKIVLVQIDEKSLRIAKNTESKQCKQTEEKFRQRYLDYCYLANIINKLSSLNTKTIGIDYILNAVYEHETKSKILHQEIERINNNNNTLTVFAYEQKYEDGYRNEVKKIIADTAINFNGNTHGYDLYLNLPKRKYCYKNNQCPIGYMVALVSQVNKQQINFQNRVKFSDSINNSIKNKRRNNSIVNFLYKAHIQPITKFSSKFRQMWFYPVVDYSIPKQKIYQTISACELLNTCEISSDKQKILNSFDTKIVLIAPGVYSDMDEYEKQAKDNRGLLLAIAYWRDADGWKDFFDGNNTFTGGEMHAYMIHHFINRDLVIPIPDCGMILAVAILGKFIAIKLLIHSESRQFVSYYFTALVLIYCLLSLIISLQIYLSFRILVPWLLPSVTLWNYIRLELKEKNYVKNYVPTQ
ncbi:MAG: CHASE2 domain-containing protein [Rivularia sp. (in: Bacteria)]|nr:CHASE2 domain-containing protein [Rivularia sp. MS3]